MWHRSGSQYTNVCIADLHKFSLVIGFAYTNFSNWISRLSLQKQLIVTKKITVFKTKKNIDSIVSALRREHQAVVERLALDVVVARLQLARHRLQRLDLQHRRSAVANLGQVVCRQHRGVRVLQGENNICLFIQPMLLKARPVKCSISYI